MTKDQYPGAAASALALIATETERLISSPDRAYEVNARRADVQLRFTQTLARHPEQDFRASLLREACYALMGNFEGSPEEGKLLGDPGTIVVRLACLNFLAQEAHRRGTLELAPEKIHPLLAAGGGMMALAIQNYKEGNALDRISKALVRIDPDAELLVPDFGDPRRQRLYAEAEA